jgi:hypothetical protein
MEEKVWSERKLTALAQLMSFLTCPPSSGEDLSESDQRRLGEMIKVNLFRDCPRIDLSLLMFAVLPAGIHDKAWRHLEVVYLILYKVLCHWPEHPVFDLDFVASMLKLFSTPNVDERQELVQFFKNYIPKRPDHRDFIFNGLCRLVQRHVESQEAPFEVCGALPVMLSICESLEWEPSFADATERFVIPLLHDRYLDLFHLSVVNLLEYYLNERPDGHVTVVREILKFWPKTKVSKMVILTTMLVDYLPRLEEKELLIYLPPFLHLIAENLNSSSPRLAEVSYAVFLSLEFDHIIFDHPELVLAILIPAVQKSMVEHWESSIRERGVFCMAFMEKFGSKLFKQLSHKEECTDNEEKWRSNWEAVRNAAEACDSPSIVLEMAETTAQA